MKQKRGIRFIVGVLLAILAFSQVGFLVSTPVAKAAGGCIFCSGTGTFTPQALPATVKEMIDNPSVVGLSTSDLGPMGKYYYDNIRGTSGSLTLPMYPGATSTVDAFEKVYNLTYEKVSETDRWWQDFVNHISADVIGANPDPADPSQFNDAVYNTMKNYGANVVPPLMEAYAGLQILNALNTPANFTAVNGVYSSINQGIFNELTHDLDIGNRDGQVSSPGILSLSALGSVISAIKDAGSLSTKQTKYLIKWNLTNAFQKGANTSASDKVYGTTADFYTDYLAVYNSILALINTKAANADDVKTDIATLMSMATTVDNDGLGTTAAGAGPCGTAPTIFQIVKTLSQAFCGITVLIANFNQVIVSSAGYILAKMIPLPGGTPSPTNSFFVNLIPAGITPANILDTLNNHPFVADTIDLIIRTLGSLLIFALLVVALANILQIQLNLYAIKKAVPALIVGFLLALSAPFSTKVCIEFANNLSGFIFSSHLNAGKPINIDTIIAKVTRVDGKDPNTPLDLTSPDGHGGSEPDMNKVFQQIILNTLALVAAVLMFILAFLFTARAVIFLFLVPLSPLAFFGITFDPLKPIWDRWWKTTQGWLFMNTVAAFWLWLMSQFFAIGSSGSATGKADLLTGLVGYAAGMVCLWFAVTTPFKMAGEAKGIYSKIEKGLNTAKQKTWDNTGGAAGKYVKDQAGIYWNRNQAVQAVKGKLQSYKDERQHDIDYAAKGLNYKAMKKEDQLEKIDTLVRNEADLKGVDKKRKELLAESEHLQAEKAKGVTLSDDDQKKLEDAIKNLDLLDIEERRLRQDSALAEKGLKRGSRGNLKSLQREMFKTKTEDLHKASEDTLRRSAQARVAQKSSAMKKLDSSIRDLKAIGEETEFVGKTELNRAFTEGESLHGGDSEADKAKVATNRQIRTARGEAVKELEADNTEEEKLHSALKYIFDLKDPAVINDITDKEKGIARNQGAKVRDFIKADALKADKGFNMSKNYALKGKLMVGGYAKDVIDKSQVNDYNGRFDLITAAGDVARIHLAIVGKDKPGVERKPDIAKALKSAKTFLEASGDSSAADYITEINGFLKRVSGEEDPSNKGHKYPEDITDIGGMSKFLEDYKKSEIADKLKKAYQDAHWVMVGRSFG